MSIQVTINPGGVTQAILGISGPKGTQGAQGPTGIPGEQGIQGPPGNDGDNAVPGEFGTSAPINIDYVSARGVNLFTNGTGLLGNAYNMSSLFEFDAIVSPNLAGSFKIAGYYPGDQASIEPMSIDPNRIYELTAHIRQEGLAGDWSGFTHQERHQQYMGVLEFDVDGHRISPDQSHETL